MTERFKIGDEVAITKPDAEGSFDAVIVNDTCNHLHATEGDAPAARGYWYEVEGLEGFVYHASPDQVSAR
jgi:hypothetical protein